GTQGGMIVRHNFPVDGEYQIQSGGARVDMTIDGVPVSTGARGRIPVRAGSHTIGVANVPGFDSAGMDGVFSVPPARGRRMSVTIPGPYLTSGPGDTPSRRRIFVCRPANAGQEFPCVREILRTLATRAFRHRVTDDDPSMQALLQFYQDGRDKGNFDTGIQNA